MQGKLRNPVSIAYPYDAIYPFHTTRRRHQCHRGTGAGVAGDQR
jgi:hypothetical protein